MSKSKDLQQYPTANTSVAHFQIPNILHILLKKEKKVPNSLLTSTIFFQGEHTSFQYYLHLNKCY